MSSGSSSRSGGQQEASGSSGFTEEEILNELKDMGYALNPQQIAGLKKELDALVAEDEAALIGQGTSSQSGAATRLDTVSADPWRALSEAERLHKQIHTHAAMQTVNTQTHDATIEALMAQAEQLTQTLRNENDRLIKTYSRPSSAQNVRVQQPQGETAVKELVIGAEKSGDERQVLKEIEQMLIKEGGLTKGDRVQIPIDDFESFIKSQSRAANSDKLSEPTIRPVIQPEVGAAPFKHDPVKRYELYQKEWAKYPAPGDQKREKLRWKVREYMLRQDIPVLSVQK